jgi:hypothetical protein
MAVSGLCDRHHSYWLGWHLGYDRPRAGEKPSLPERCYRFGCGNNRGFVVPTFIKFLANVITLLVFLVFGLPGVRERVDFSEPGDATTQMTSGGLAAILVGILTLSVKTLVGASHVYEGNNWVDVLKMPLIISGSVLTIGGLALIFRPTMEAIASALRRRSEHPVR